MQWLTPVPEDYGLQRLQRDNRAPATARAVDAVAAAASTGARDAPELPPRTPTHDRRRAERRRGERRKQQVPVLLDTRCPHDRRAIGDRRCSTNPQDTPAPRRRLDLYA